MKTKRKTYVIKNKVTGKYFASGYGSHARWTKNLFNAETYSKSWVDDTISCIRAGDNMLGKNDEFVEVTIKEVR